MTVSRIFKLIFSIVFVIGIFAPLSQCAVPLAGDTEIVITSEISIWNSQADVIDESENVYYFYVAMVIMFLPLLLSIQQLVMKRGSLAVFILEVLLSAGVIIIVCLSAGMILIFKGKLAQLPNMDLVFWGYLTLICAIAYIGVALKDIYLYLSNPPAPRGPAVNNPEDAGENPSE